MELVQEGTEEEDEAFLRQLVLPEEDRRRRFPTSVWTGGYRWFRSKNVIPLERYRTSKEIDRIRVNILRRYLQLVGL